ncbi:Asp/Glu/hydantoin racemase [Mycobacterium frederiksbergense]|uniref:Asp/Glu/hydantoin racemase n=1 Tax=Mycolicibacterium frederiksbergense TaxID=117567 RepID=A0ABT6L1N4_9MYCO|nr:aspartate/glutamate racemase family protein [Mycolicibacterium frederiksbergense]MDH6196849.1 Asp/Glu/hydantoin racemase [Mycolicibacterium frederiksbergense]
MTNKPRIALVSATPVAIPPAVAAINRALPHATIWNLLDDRLLADAEERGGIDPALEQRMRALIGLAVAGGADAVLLTCSLYGVVAEELANDVGVPLLAPDTAMFDEVAASTHRSVLVVASLDSAATDTGQRLARRVDSVGKRIRLDSVHASAAANAAKHGDVVGVADAIMDVIGDADGWDGVVLAQYSIAGADAILTERLGKPVYSAPAAAARKLSMRIGGPA